jgi:hypothetical protein
MAGGAGDVAQGPLSGEHRQPVHCGPDGVLDARAALRVEHSCVDQFVERGAELTEGHSVRPRPIAPSVVGVPLLAFLAEQLFSGQVEADGLFEVAVVHHTQCGTGFLADPGFRHRAAEATGLAEPALEASAVADPHVTVKADVERLLTAPNLSPKVSVSGHVYDIATGRVTTTVDARHPSGLHKLAGADQPPSHARRVPPRLPRAFRGTLD